MSIRGLVGGVNDNIPVKTVLASVFNKTGLESLVPGILEVSPEVLFLSTGGTYKKLQEILGSSAKDHLMEVAEYTGDPEMEGGLVKTLHPKIHGGILGERNNPLHRDYVNLKNGRFIDMVIANLYPFEDVIAKPGATFEDARGNIDIGGPSMVRGAAKNFLGCAVVIDPNDYADLLYHIRMNNGSTSLDYRLSAMPKAFAHTAAYDKAIADFMIEHVSEDKENTLKNYEIKRD